ncbi:hypothetical protein [Streptococcus azizii]
MKGDDFKYFLQHRTSWAEKFRLTSVLGVRIAPKVQTAHGLKSLVSEVFLERLTRQKGFSNENKSRYYQPTLA